MQFQFAQRLKEWEEFLLEEALNDEETEFKTVCAVFAALFMGYIVFWDFSEVIFLLAILHLFKFFNKSKLTI